MVGGFVRVHCHGANKRLKIRNGFELPTIASIGKEIGEELTSLTIQDFTANHIENVVDLVSLLWHNPQEDRPAKLQSLLNQYIIRYYFIPRSNFNLVASEGGKICACLMAAKVKDVKNHSADEWVGGRLTTAADLACLSEIKAGLDAMRDVEHQHAKENEAALLFFGSTRKGAGKLLMSEFEKRCKEQGVSSMILWTDERCDYDYYYKKGFEEVLKLPSPTLVDGRHLETWVFRKEFF